MTLLSGQVNDENLPMVEMTVRNAGWAASLQFLVDTGFNGELGMPIDGVARYLFPDLGGMRHVRTPLGPELRRAYIVDLDWLGETTAVEVLDTERELLGSGLFVPSQVEVHVDYGPARSVRLQAP